MGASCEELGLDFTVGEGPRADSGFFAFVAAVFATDEDRAEEADVLDTDGVGVLRVGVEDLEADLDAAGTEGLAAGVEERELVLAGAAAIVLAEGNDALEVGVEGLDVFDMEGTRGRPVGVADLEAVDFLPPADAGLPFPVELEFMLLEEVLLPEDVDT